jgi:phage shock protein PspC (stress-responsive transcriptional regulator)
MANTPKNQKTTKTNKTTETTEVGPRRPLLRSKDDRMIWGVAGGLAAHVGFNATLVRLAFVVITLFGGAGLLAYLVLAVALPQDDGTGKPVEESVWARLGKVVLVCILVGIALGLAAGLALVSAWVTATGHGTAIAATVIVLGLALAAAAFATDVRRRAAPPLLVLALVLGIPAGGIAAADIEFDNSVGQRSYTPTLATDIPADGYKLGTGQLVVDLRQLPWKPGQTIAVSAHLGLGQMIVSAPPNVCVVGHVTGKAGELIMAGDVSQGIDPEVEKGSATSNAPRLDFDGDIQLGQMIVTDQDPDRVEDHVDRHDHHTPQAAEQRQVCGR